MSRRPKHYDRPGQRPGPERVRSNDSGGSIIDQRAPHIELQADCKRGEHLYVTGRRTCPLCGAEL